MWSMTSVFLSIEGFWIWSDIDHIRIQPLRTNRIRIQPFRTNRIQIHEFLKTGSGSKHLCVENFPSILWWFLIRNCCLFHFLSFSPDKSLLEPFLLFFFVPGSGSRLKPDPDPEKFDIFFSTLCMTWWEFPPCVFASKNC